MGPRRRCRRLGAVMALASLALASPSEAHGPNLGSSPFNGVDWFVSPGLTLGLTSSFDVGTDVHIGGEVSAGYTADYFFYALFVDLLYDAGRENLRLGVGPEFGFGPFGVDGGLLLEFGSEKTYAGGTVRLFASLGYAFVYVRYGGLVDAPDFMEFGIGLKLPLRRVKQHFPPGHEWTI